MTPTRTEMLTRQDWRGWREEQRVAKRFKSRGYITVYDVIDGEKKKPVAEAEAIKRALRCVDYIIEVIPGVSANGNWFYEIHGRMGTEPGKTPDEEDPALD